MDVECYGVAMWVHARYAMSTDILFLRNFIWAKSNLWHLVYHFNLMNNFPFCCGGFWQTLMYHIHKFLWHRFVSWMFSYWVLGLKPVLEVYNTLLVFQPLSWTNMEHAYCVVIVLICLNVLWVFVTRFICFVSKLFIDGICFVALALATRTISGVTFHPLVVILLMSGWCFIVGHCITLTYLLGKNVHQQ